MLRGWTRDTRARRADLSEYGLSCRMAPSVQAFGDFLDDLCRKGRQISGIPGCDHALVNYNRRILPLGSGIDHVGLDRVIGGGVAPLDDAGLNQEPGRVANCRDHFVLIEERADETQRILIYAQ